MIIFGAILSYYVHYIAKKVRIYVKNDTLSIFLGIARLSVSLISFIPWFAAEILILIFSVFYFARDDDKVIQYIKDIIPDKDKEFYQQIFNRCR
jgi:predicted PurR-regulated permease PerM